MFIVLVQPSIGGCRLVRNSLVSLHRGHCKDIAIETVLMYRRDADGSAYGDSERERQGMLQASAMSSRSHSRYPESE